MKRRSNVVNITGELRFSIVPVSWISNEDVCKCTISKFIKRKIELMGKGLNYTPMDFVRNLRMNRDKTIVLIFFL